MTYTNSNQIGEVTEIKGVAKIIRTDGSEEPITMGTPVFQGDIVETTGDGAVNIGFADDSSFAVSDDARITIDEFVFDPVNESGDQDFSVARGVFMYTSGLIGRENPDSVEIDTPVGAIGIRGTIIGGDINPDGESQVTVIEGAIVVQNDAGEQLLTNQFDTVKLTARDVAPSNVQQLNVQEVVNNFDTIKDVSASLFSSFQDQIQQETNDNGSSNDGNIPAEETNADASNDDSDQNADSENNSDNENADEAVLLEEAQEEAAETAEEQAKDEDVQDIAEDTADQLMDATDEANNTETLEEAVDNNIETLENAIEAKTTDADSGKENIQTIKAKAQASREKTVERKAEADQKAEEIANNTDTTNNINNPIDINVLNNIIGNNRDNDTTPAPLALGPISGSGEIDENADGTATAISIGQVGVVSGDATGVTYTLSGVDSGLFIIDQNTGDITFDSVARDYETDSSDYTFEVTATNANGQTVTQTINIDLNDVNEQSFITGNTTPAAIVENNNDAGGLANDVNVATLTFTELDSDASNQTTFTVDDPRFDVEVDTATGDLKLIAKAGEQFDHETTASINVTITADDGSFGTDVDVITVNISNINEDPTDITYTGGSLFENDNNGTIVATLSTADEDAGDTTFTYTLENDPSGIFSIVGDQIRVDDNTNLDFENAEDHTLTIRTTDSSGNYHEEDITINVNDINEAPVIALNDTLSINEGDTDIVIDDSILEATDIDASDTPENIHYQVVSVPNNGILYLNGTVLNATDSFTHQDIIDGLVTYSHDGSETTTDAFGFALEDGGEDGVAAIAGTFNINITPVNEAADISAALGDQFDVTGGIDGVLQLGAFAAKALKINIHDPEGGSFGAGDFTINGTLPNGLTASNYFEIFDNSGEFLLRLKPSYKIIAGAGDDLFLNDGTSNIGTALSSASPFGFDVILNDSGEISTMTVDLTADAVNLVASGVEVNVYSNEIYFGSAGADEFKLQVDDFKLIRGGQGYDVIKLDYAGQGATDATARSFDLTSTVSNLIGSSADLKSIEEFRFVDDNDTLKMNIQDLKDLLRTSDNTTSDIAKVIFGSGGAPSTTGTDDSVNGIHFSNDGGTTFDMLENHGFVKQSDYNDGTENYEVFEYTFANGDVGQVLIESDINGATAGGL